MNDEVKVGEATILIKLNDGRELALKPSAGAMIALSRSYGGLSKVLDKLGELDFDTALRVVELGMGVTNPSAKYRAKLSEDLYQTGMNDATGSVILRCMEYIHVLLNGGRPLPVEETDDGDEVDTSDVDPK